MIECTRMLHGKPEAGRLIAVVSGHQRIAVAPNRSRLVLPRAASTARPSVWRDALMIFGRKWSCSAQSTAWGSAVLILWEDLAWRRLGDRLASAELHQIHRLRGKRFEGLVG